MVNKRISELSCNKKEFENAKRTYETALSEAGYDTCMQYEKEGKKPRNRKRQVIWFNPPFSQNVKTNLGKSFLNLLEKHFPKHHKLHGIFNRNNVKLSYCCMSNIGNLIQAHNSRVLQEPLQEQKKQCNCRVSADCPLEGECLTSCVVYQATATTEDDNKVYYGLVEGDFKGRYQNHIKSFNHRRYEHDTELSAAQLWKLKDLGKEYSLK